MADLSPERKSGCGILSAVFGQRSFWPRRSTSTGSNANIFSRTPSTTKRRKSASDETAYLDKPSNTGVPGVQQQQKPVTSVPVYPKIPPVQQNSYHPPPPRQENYASTAYVNQGKKVPKEAVGLFGELESMIVDHQKTKGSSTLVRASSSNVMLMGNLGNIRQSGVNNYPDSQTSNVVKQEQTYEYQEKPSSKLSQSLCRALSTRMDPEQLKIMGNEDYKNGNFAEALALYEAAISIDPNKASYRSNKSAALTALGRLLEAVFECREAIRIEPNYHRAHHRLANLYLRLGEAEKAIYHFKHAGPEADQIDIAKAKSIQVHLNKCTEARRLRDWNTLVKETCDSVSAGADSDPQIYALQAEALLKLRRHEEANEILMKGPNFDVDECSKFFGPIGNANLLSVRAQVDMAIGRFDDAIAKAQRATRLDSNNKDAGNVLRKARAVAQARSNGNQLFKAGKYYEASVAYGEGLEHELYNSVLLCNRAACRSKLGQYEKAVEDCNSALNVRPAYAKARLRRADCNAKLGKWEESMQDYEILRQELPNDKEVLQALEEAKSHLMN